MRHPRRKTFHLGPSLVTLGRAAGASTRHRGHRRAAAAAADDLAIAITLAMPWADALVIADLIHPAGRRSRTYQLTAYGSYSARPTAPRSSRGAAPRSFDRWIRRGSPDANGADTEALHNAWPRSALAASASKSTAARTTSVTRSPLPTAGGSLRARSIDLRIDDWMRDKQLVNDLHDREEVWPVSVSAPIFDADAHAIAVVSTLDHPDRRRPRRSSTSAATCSTPAPTSPRRSTGASRSADRVPSGIGGRRLRLPHVSVGLRGKQNGAGIIAAIASLGSSRWPCWPGSGTSCTWSWERVVHVGGLD